MNVLEAALDCQTTSKNYHENKIPSIIRIVSINII